MQLFRHFCWSLALLFSALTPTVAQRTLAQAILQDPQNPYYIDFAHYPKHDATLPVGVFDSGTGGLTVFNAIVTFDEFNNATGQPGADGQPDFAKEDFLYLADQANMPYGNYAAAGKTPFLKELILKDAQFLMSTRYHTRPGTLATDKKPIKALVIACNTGTAYGKDDIEALLHEGGSELKVIGVIDAGVRGALSLLKPTENSTIGVFATAGTVASGGYARKIEAYRQKMGYTGRIQIVSQGGVGIAEAIDEDLSFIDRKATSVRDNYKGPNVNANAQLAIDKTLLKIYNFDFQDYKMLCDARTADDCSNLQINAAENYVRFHLVSLLEQMRATPHVQPLKVLILGCTHYPYMTQTIGQVLTELRNYRENGRYRYRKLLAKKVHLVDPSVNTARELYTHLATQKLQNTQGSLQNTEFYITVPDPNAPNVALEADGQRFTYAYKYGRNSAVNTTDVATVPFSRQNIPAPVAERLKAQIPAVYTLIQHFAQHNHKTQYLQPEERLRK